MNHNHEDSHNDVILPYRHDDLARRRRMIFGVLMLAGLGMAMWGMVYLLGFSDNINGVIVGVMMVLALGGIVPIAIAKTYLKPKYCRICNVVIVSYSDYCQKCLPIILTALEMHDGPIICRMCSEESENYGSFVIHFNKKHDGGWITNDHAMGSDHFQKYFPENEAIKKIV
ncbi:hypothetical protein [Nitrosopumilus sp.]|uniref:hypothetical protein n=1 Tax=Nitrosopumilus sp. TaxID=2024843 RepID=UPI003B59675B